MTKLLYQSDSYLNKFAGKVLATDEESHAIVLDQTVFYPGGGGQPSDIGLVSYNSKDLKVTGARKKGDNILHLINLQDHLPEIGTNVSGEINWERRYRLMRTHTALHILCGVVFRDYGALVTGGDMSPLKGRMDFEFERMQKDLVESIELAVNIEVSNDLPIRVKILEREEAFQIPDLIRTKINLLPENILQVRVVDIVGLDLQADGGTHVNTTGEVGRIRIRDYKSKGKINKRIYIELDD